MHKTKVLLKSAFRLNEDFNDNLASFSLLSKISNGQKEKNDKNLISFGNEALNAKAVAFTDFLRKHIHGMELSVVPKAAYDIYNNNSNTNESILTYTGEKIADLDDFYILSNKESKDINDYYYIIEDEKYEIENDTRIKNPSEYGYDISPDNLFGILIDTSNKNTGSNEKLFKCIKYLKKAGE